MNQDYYLWNKTLKFSWGHIIAFVGLIAISYVAYMGVFYATGGNFVTAAVSVAGADVALLLTFIGAQMIKGTDDKFARRIIVERILVILCPIVLVAVMLPCNHFWNVFGEREHIETLFKKSVIESGKIFDEYEVYADSRIADYADHLAQLVSQKSLTPTQADNYARTLRLQLHSANTDSLQRSARRWIDRSAKGASVWNAFLIGNVATIASAINEWNKTLNATAGPTLSNESGNIPQYKGNAKAFSKAIDGFLTLNDTYKNVKGFAWQTPVTALIAFIMLFFPYLLQSRNTRAEGYYRLLPGGKKPAYARPKKHKGNDTDGGIGTGTAGSDYGDGGDIYSGSF